MLPIDHGMLVGPLIMDQILHKKEKMEASGCPYLSEVTVDTVQF